MGLWGREEHQQNIPGAFPGLSVPYPAVAKLLFRLRAFL
jgi:hypothetical protein